MTRRMHQLAALDHEYIWHPFTQMRDWLKVEPILIRSGRGAVLRDVHGREYLDANASIWTNLHGHRHPHLDKALRRQTRKIAHSSALGLANEPASLLGERLAQLTKLDKVFYSDNGSTALEVALKLAYEYARRTGQNRRPRFLSLAGAYHGDTLGAVSVGHIDLFHQAYAGLLFKSEQVMAPYCYRCPFNRAKPERADAREYRQCRWQCVDKVAKAFGLAQRRSRPLSALVVEPLVQGAAGMIAQPVGWLSRVAEIARMHRAQIVADEVMTGFGRTGFRLGPGKDTGVETEGLFACDQERVRPDLMAVAKGLTGGYLPMAATLTSRAIFDVFLGEFSEFKTFFHGHSYTGNQLGSAVSLANLELLTSPANRRLRRALQQNLSVALMDLWRLDAVGDIRQVGLMAGIELVRNWRTREPFSLTERAGARVGQAMARRGVLTRPIGNVLVLMPPYCTTRGQVRKMVNAMAESIAETFPSR